MDHSIIYPKIFQGTGARLADLSLPNPFISFFSVFFFLLFYQIDICTSLGSLQPSKFVMNEC